MIVDIVTYNGEKEMFDLRYNILKDVVDKFVVVEFDKTFTGRPKKSRLHKDLGQGYEKLTLWHVTEEDWGPYKQMALQSPNTEFGKGAAHWVTEFCQKESIKVCLEEFADDDILFIGDVDEIWDPKLAQYEPKKTHKLGLRVYSYYLNNRSSELFYGTIFTKYGLIKFKCLNHIRSLPNYHEYIPQGGWHFTSMGGPDRVREKLTDSYTIDSYANQWVLDNLQDNIENRKDFMGRNFTYQLDESEWPQYLKENKDKYKHLLKDE